MRLVLANTFIIDSTPLQIYSSVLAFTPQKSKVRETFENVIPDWISLRPEAETNWNQCLQTFEGHSGWVNSVAFSHDSTLVASASADETVRIWRTDTGEGIQELKGHSRSVSSVTFSHDSALVASASDDETVRIWRTDTGEGIQEFKGHSGWVYSIAFSHDSTLVASASVDETVRIWRTDTGEGIQELKDHSGGVRSVVFSHDSALVASASVDETVRIWRTNTGEGIQKLKGHSGGVRSVVFSHDSALVASASDDETVRIWRTDTGECVRKADVGEGVSWLSFESDNSRLLTSVGAITIGRLPLSEEATVDTISNSGHDYRFGYGFSRDRCWITWNGHNLLWLPVEFRPVQSAVSGFTVVIGCSSGRVIFIQFSTQKLPRLFI
jgi:WD40 repeat protein